MQEQNSLENSFDIYVIVDNCTDQTKKISEELGAFVYERFDQNKKTKVMH